MSAHWSIPVPVRRRIARGCIWVCLALILVAALLLTFAPHTFPLSAMLRTDLPALSGIIFGRYYLHSTRCRP